MSWERIERERYSLKKEAGECFVSLIDSDDDLSWTAEVQWSDGTKSGESRFDSIDQAMRWGEEALGGEGRAAERPAGGETKRIDQGLGGTSSNASGASPSASAAPMRTDDRVDALEHRVNALSNRLDAAETSLRALKAFERAEKKEPKKSGSFGMTVGQRTRIEAMLEDVAKEMFPYTEGSYSAMINFTDGSDHLTLHVWADKDGDR